MIAAAFDVALLVLLVLAVYCVIAFGVATAMKARLRRNQTPDASTLALTCGLGAATMIGLLVMLANDWGMPVRMAVLVAIAHAALVWPQVERTIDGRFAKAKPFVLDHNN
ncbi:MAG: hypothetical protein Q7V88_04005 [Actinomycetota bacterium]|nr:hypothetical protein [Actinomycetota bacterium]